MTDNPPSVTVQPSQYNFIQGAQPLASHDHELWSNGHQLGIDSAGPYPTNATMDHVNALPPTRYGTSTGYNDPPDLVTWLSPKGSAEQQGHQSQLDDHRMPGITQCVAIAPGPPRLEHHDPTIPEVPNKHPPSHTPLPQNITGPSRGNPSVVRPRVSATEDLKNMASHYLHNPGSHVDKLRMKRSQSGTLKVLILLEIDDTM